MTAPRHLTDKGREIIADGYVQLLREGEACGAIREFHKGWGISYKSMMTIVLKFYTRKQLNEIRTDNARVQRLGLYATKSRSGYILHHNEPILGRPCYRLARDAIKYA